MATALAPSARSVPHAPSSEPYWAEPAEVVPLQWLVQISGLRMDYAAALYIDDGQQAVERHVDTVRHGGQGRALVSVEAARYVVLR